MRATVSISRKLAWQALILYQKTREEPSAILRALMPPDITKADLDLAWELTNGSIRYLKKLDYIAQSLIKAPLKKQKAEIVAALRLGLYQLLETSGIPDFAAVNETVGLIKDVFSQREAGFVNAVLRNYRRKPIGYPDKEDDPVEYLSTYYSYPQWLVRRWYDRFGFEETESMLMAGNARPSLNLKVITSRISRDEVIEKLRQEGINADKSSYLPDFIRCEDSRSVLRSDVFKSGFLNVQDEAQGIASLLLEIPVGETVLDLCSAPGGKTIALADMVGDSGRVLSLDDDKNRMRELESNIERTGFRNIEVVRSDLFEFASSEKFGYILLDVPCSGLGTIAARADLRWSKEEKDIARLAAIQIRMLEKAAAMLRESGTLVYSTCTTEPEEIEDIITGFLKSSTGFRLGGGNSSYLEPFKTEIGIYRSWPHKHGIGGGGFAKLVKGS